MVAGNGNACARGSPRARFFALATVPGIDPACCAVPSTVHISDSSLLRLLQNDIRAGSNKTPRIKLEFTAAESAVDHPVEYTSSKGDVGLPELVENAHAEEDLRC